jgi:squalene-hopene/tetraprenyl-beta-curcumene cyclase
VPFPKSEYHFLSFPRKWESRKSTKKEGLSNLIDELRKSSSCLLETAVVMNIDRAALDRTLALLKNRLLQSRPPRLPAGRQEWGWQGQLSSSALSTAAAVFALSMVDKAKHNSLICNGLGWLSKNQNSDGGWGDTVRSRSNISTTLLCWSAFAISEDSQRYKETTAKTRSWLINFAGSLKPAVLADSVDKQYGKDRSFSAPILTMCALADRLGGPEEAWRQIKPLPFELAICPHQLFKWLRLPVVSYALPVLIAIGQVHYHYRKPRNPVTKLLRHLTRGKTLDVLRSLQPQTGGFLEAIPLTAFVVMGLAACGETNHDVVSKGTCFLVNSARDDGSWPIDTNLAVWVTTLAVNVLSSAPDFESILSLEDRTNILNWLLSSQHHQVHPYTHADIGGWGWTNLPGAVPDADDTAGALIALRNLGLPDEPTTNAAIAGLKWLMKLQNRDGGIPTFCRGWLSLPFDRSTPDITAHTAGAIGSWFDVLPNPLKKSAEKILRKMLTYLERVQKEDGSWVPLWFGNQFAPNQENPVYGTARVLTGLTSASSVESCRVPQQFVFPYLPMMQKAIQWLLSAQNQDGGWGGAKAVKSTIEETALSVDALASCFEYRGLSAGGGIENRVSGAISRGVRWLIEQTKEGTIVTPSPIGLYFAKLWYFEELYPVIFTVSALQKVRNLYSIM